MSLLLAWPKLITLLATMIGRDFDPVHHIPHFVLGDTPEIFEISSLSQTSDSIFALLFIFVTCSVFLLQQFFFFVRARACCMPVQLCGSSECRRTVRGVLTCFCVNHGPQLAVKSGERADVFSSLTNILLRTVVSSRRSKGVVNCRVTLRLALSSTVDPSRE